MNNCEARKMIGDAILFERAARALERQAGEWRSDDPAAFEAAELLIRRAEELRRDAEHLADAKP